VFSERAPPLAASGIDDACAYEHQSILVTSVWMAGSAQAASAEVKYIPYYTRTDLSLGKFLLDSCFSETVRVAGDRRSVFDITQASTLRPLRCYHYTCPASTLLLLLLFLP